MQPAMSEITHARADKSFVSRRRSKFVGHTPPVQCSYCLLILIRRQERSNEGPDTPIVNPDDAGAGFAVEQSSHDWAKSA